MVRRKFDSSLTRVAPVFDELLAMDRIGNTWLPRLIGLAEPGRSTLPDPGPLIEWGWGADEHGLRPSAALLRWLVENPESLRREGLLAPSSPQARLLRERLIGGDADVKRQAIGLLQRPHRNRAWFVFEGVTYPDAYMKTLNAIIVIEGKRTEPDITRSTTWMAIRHQMLRHIDSAWDDRELRTVLGMFIVEGNGGAEGVEVPPL